MISNYEIKKENNKEILYLYIDVNDEFSLKKIMKSNKKIEENIKAFINKNKIIFSGTMAVLIVNGLFAGNVLLNKDKSKAIIKNNKSVITEVIKDNEIKEELNENINEITEDKSTNESTFLETKEENNAKIESHDVSNNKLENNNISDKIEEKIETKKEEVIDDNIYVNVKRRNQEIITIELEEYIYGVVSAEMPAEFNQEALKAQAIISRTYTLKALSKNKILTDNESTQSYKDDNELKVLWGSKYDIYSNKIKSAVNATKGLYLSYNGNYIEAVFHSTSNGKTENSVNVWGNEFPYLISVDSEYDKTNKSFYSEKEISYDELSSKLGTMVNIDTDFYITEKTEGDRVKNININDKSFTGIKIRSLLNLRSADFEIEKTDSGVKFKTKGYGHGVGLSQYGANGMANAGYSFDQILSHYYPLTNLSSQ